MKRFIADFHIHSHHSVATSADLTPEYLDLWARLKGVTVVGTGDFTHPGWVQELQEKLEPAEQGLFRLRRNFSKDPPFRASWLERSEVRFILSGEISSIYTKQGSVRKVHNLILAPGFEAVENIQKRLTARRANITSDGRPILGMDCRDLLELILDASSGEALFIPAHIWTPWFSVLGDRSGFDSITECFDDLSSHIHALETGLSSDPPMNWLCSFIDRFTLVSNSDAHSPDKVGREANIFSTELSYLAMIQALKSGDAGQFGGTLEFFPQEGKYHFDGHRKCGTRWHPRQTRENNGVCPVCGKPVTVGVMNRVMQLADRSEVSERPARHPFFSLIPLREVLAEIWNTRPESKKIQELYRSIIKAIGPELTITLDSSLEQIKAAAGEELAEGIRRMRERRVLISEGYDGEYGRIRVFAENELKRFSGQKALLSIPITSKTSRKPETGEPEKNKSKKKKEGIAVTDQVEPAIPASSGEANLEQEAAIRHGCGPALVVAGPGTGKTRVLTSRIARLIESGAARPDEILAVTFTNKASREMQERLALLLPGRMDSSPVRIATFHAFGLSVLKEYHQALGRTSRFQVIDEEDRLIWVKAHGIGGRKDSALLVNEISRCKGKMLVPEDVADTDLRKRYGEYQDLLRSQDAFDLDDLIFATCRLLGSRPEIAAACRERFRHVLVDESQDMNEGQYMLLKFLKPGAEANLYLVGDPDQSIYGFRGADPGLVQRFNDEYRPALYRLKRSYRCTGTILKASGAVLKKNESDLLSGLQPGVKVRIMENPTDRSEAEFIARTIEEMIGGVRFFSMDSQVASGGSEAGIAGFGDFAVLCRTAGQFPVLQEGLQNHGIPWQAAEEKPFFSTGPMRILLDMLRFSLRPEDLLLEKSLLERGLAQARLREMADVLRSHATVCARLAFLVDALPVAKEAEADLERLQQMADPYGERVSDFVSQMILGRGGDTVRSGMESVPLLTLHAAKGLEFSCVFIAGCEEGLLPYKLFPGQETDVDEEMRLLYVGMTRARRYLFLTNAKRRRLFGRTWNLPRSSFLDRIERGLLEISRHEPKKDDEPRQRKLFDL